MKKLLTISLIAFTIFGLSSCYTKKSLTNRQQYEDYMKNRKGEFKADEKKMVLNLVTNLSDTITFSKKNPGVISETEVSGYPTLILPFADADSMTISQNVIQFVWKDGNNYAFISQDKTGYTCTSDKVTIPFQEIAQMEVRGFNKKKTAGTVILGVTVPLTVAFVTIVTLIIVGW